MTAQTAYCTIISENYLPKALTLAGSLDRHHPGTPLVVLLIDAKNDDELPVIPDLPGVHLVSTAVLGLDEREVLHLAATYSLIEFATAVKPLLLKKLLETSEQASYLDPDTYVTAPMTELPVDLTATVGGILLTPHFLRPVGPGAPFSEGHLLNVGVFNLGFCAVDRRAGDFLDWWWDHLKAECLWEPLAGLFVDQKWVDIGSTLFHADAWQHSGYNVSVANLHERPLGSDVDGYYIASTGDRLRLFHFHSFDTNAPGELSTRQSSTAHMRTENPAVDALCVEYAAALVHHEQTLPAAPPYPYDTDTRGRRISRHLRRAYRLESASRPLPSPFLASDAAGYDAWRRRAWRTATRELVGDTAKSLRLVLPDEYSLARKRFPKLARSLRERFVSPSGFWR